MRKPERDTRILPYIEKACPDSSYEEKLELSFQFRRIFDAWWAIALRLAREKEEAEKGEREKKARESELVKEQLTPPLLRPVLRPLHR
jgi:hypothetical protein